MPADEDGVARDEDYWSLTDCLLIRHHAVPRQQLFLWGEGEVSGLLVKAGRIGVSENMIKQMMAVISMIFEVMGKESPTKGQVVAQVKKCAIKMKASIRKIVRDHMRIED